MPDKPTLDDLFDLPQYSVDIGGKTYVFSELPISALSRLQAWIKDKVPHPLDAIKPHLEGLTERERTAVIAEAVREGFSWPPRIGTAKAAAILLGTDEGQVQVLYEGLKVHQPDVTLDEAERIYSALNRQVKRRAARKLPPEGVVTRIYGVLFGTYDPAEDDDPKSGGEAAAGPVST